MNKSGFDIIGDIHGHGSALVNLLTHLGYRRSPTGYRHPSRKALFLGDFIDGKHLGEHRMVLDAIRQILPNGRLTPEVLPDASTEGTPLFDAIETLLKGFEVQLPDGITFRDKGNHSRSAVRVAWWNRSAQFLGEVVLPPEIDMGHAAQQPIPEGSPRYPEDAVPCFVGHYWLTGQPNVLASNVACLDYSVGNKGKRVAYRWSGEQVLENANFAFVEESA